ncbi:hypothetical protein [uncultured Alteromonas sp.]|jgi:hypothetical protein|uniref:hypothetical protein n=1 Tax=uncultured Alteromonas sp. TaxID=179113 RepID=UPI002588C056|nr:hypothetical protein [uncultured Alteromonas sp.]
MKNKGVCIATVIVIIHSYSVLAEENDNAKGFLSFDIPKGLNLSLSKEDSKGTVGANFVRADNIYGISLTGKLKDNTGEFVGLDGIDANTKVTGTWSHMFTDLAPTSPPNSLTFDEKSREHAKFALRECKTLNAIIRGFGDEPIDNCENEEALITGLTKLTHDTGSAMQIARLANGIYKKCIEYSKAPWAAKYDVAEMCNSRNELELLVNSGTSSNQYAMTDFGVFSMSVSYFQSEFKWLDVNALISGERNLDDTKDGFDITLSYSHVFAKKLLKVEFGAKYQKGYSNASSNTERELCFDFDSEQNITECTNGFLFPPVETTATSPFVSFTKQLGDKQLIKSIGFDVKYTFEDKENQLSESIGLDRLTIEVPVHLVTMLDDKISAGFKASWVSEVRKNEDPFKLVLFVSAPLTVF